MVLEYHSLGHVDIVRENRSVPDFQVDIVRHESIEIK